MPEQQITVKLNLNEEPALQSHEWDPPSLGEPAVLSFLPLVRVQDAALLIAFGIMGYTFWTRAHHNVAIQAQVVFFGVVAWTVLNMIRIQGVALPRWVVLWLDHFRLLAMAPGAWGDKTLRGAINPSHRLTALLPPEVGKAIHANVQIGTKGILDVGFKVGNVPKYVQEMASQAFGKERYRRLIELTMMGDISTLSPESLRGIWSQRLNLWADLHMPFSLYVRTRPFPAHILEIAAGPVSKEAGELAARLVLRRLIMAVYGGTVDVLNQRTIELLGTDRDGKLGQAGYGYRVLDSVDNDLMPLADDAWGSRHAPVIGISPRVFEIRAGQADPYPIIRNGHEPARPRGVRQWVTFAASRPPDGKKQVGWLKAAMQGRVEWDLAVHCHPEERFLGTNTWLGLKADWYESAPMAPKDWIERARRLHRHMVLLSERTTTTIKCGIYASVPETQAPDLKAALDDMLGRNNAYIPTLRQQQGRASTEPWGRDALGLHFVTDSQTIAMMGPPDGAVVVPGGLLFATCMNFPMPLMYDPWFVHDDAPVALFVGKSGSGKRLALDTPLATPTGWTTMGEVRAGDTVFDEQGKPCRVTYASPVQQGNSYRMHFSDGSSIVADAEHLWSTWTYRARANLAQRIEGQHGRYDHRPRRRLDTVGPQVRTTAEIAASLIDKHGGTNHSIDTTEPLDLPEGELPIPPYTLGAWLGDGHSGAPLLTSADEGVLDVIREEGVGISPPAAWSHAGKAKTYRLGGKRGRGAWGSSPDKANTIEGLLRRLGLLHNKHVPDIYLRASTGQRLALLQGLMDTDGNVSTGQAEFTSTRACLSDAVYEIVVSLGMKATRNERPATLNGVVHGTSYRVVFTPTMPVFRLARKAEGIHFDRSQQSRRRRRYITAVEPVESVPMRCIAVDSPTHLYLAGRAMIPTHNTTAQMVLLASILEPHPEHILAREGPVPVVVIYFKPLDEWEAFVNRFHGVHIHAGGDDGISFETALDAASSNIGIAPIVAINLNDLGDDEQEQFTRALTARIMTYQRHQGENFRKRFALLIGEMRVLTRTQKGAVELGKLANQARALRIWLCGDTQFVDHLLNSPADDVRRNAGMVLLFRLDEGERAIVKEKFGLSDAAFEKLVALAAPNTLAGSVPVRGVFIGRIHGVWVHGKVERLGELARLGDQTNPALRESPDLFKPKTARNNGHVLSVSGTKG